MSPEHPPESSTERREPQIKEFFTEETAPNLMKLSKISLLEPSRFKEMQNDPSGAGIADCKTELNMAVEAMHTSIRFKIPATEGVEDLGAAHDAVEEVANSLVYAKGDARIKMDNAMDALGGGTSQLFIDTYNTFSQAFMYAELLDELANNN